MGLTTNKNMTLRVEIDGKEYEAPIDSPEFIEFWSKWWKWVEEKKAWGELTEAQIMKMAEEMDFSEIVQANRESTAMGVELVGALFGPEAQREIIGNFERVSSSRVSEIATYIFSEMNSQDLMGKMAAMTSKYSSNEVQGD